MVSALYLHLYLLRLFQRENVLTLFFSDGNIAAQVASKKYNKVLELIGTTTLRDSLQCVSDHGIVCMTGIVGNSWSFKDEFSPMESIPSTVCL